MCSMLFNMSACKYFGESKLQLLSLFSHSSFDGTGKKNTSIDRAVPILLERTIGTTALLKIFCVSVQRGPQTRSLRGGAEDDEEDDDEDEKENTGVRVSITLIISSRDAVISLTKQTLTVQGSCRSEEGGRGLTCLMNDCVLL